MNTDLIFDAFNKAMVAVCLERKTLDKQKQIQSVTARKCGNCRLWMTRDCVPEQTSGALRSMNSYACADFARNGSSRQLEQKFTAELDVLLGQVEELCKASFTG